MNGYELTRDWFDFRFENPDKCRPIHTELYIYLVDQWNRLGQVKMFGLPTQYTMQVLNINSYNTFKSALEGLIEFGFVKIVSESKNQHQSRVIALSNNDKATTKALDKATIKALDKATTKALDTIIEQGNNRTIEQNNNKEIIEQFELFWETYSKKVDKEKCKSKFIKLSEKDRTDIFKKIEEYVKSKPDLQFRKNPLTWLNGKCWNDDIIITNQPAQSQEPIFEKWADPSQINIKDDDWIKKVPTPPEKGTQEYFQYLDKWRIRELKSAQVDRRGYYDQF